MSGTVRVRKQWRKQEGPFGTLHRLRSSLAEDGCADSQVVVAKKLLEEAQESGDWAENTSQAVYWLTKASEYGNDEATKLLSCCLHSGTGITEENIAIVKNCLSMSVEEKAFKAAAKELFSTLTPFGQDFVTSSQLKAIIQPNLIEGTETENNCCNPEEAEDVDGGNRSAYLPFTKWYQDASLFEIEHFTEEKLVGAAGTVAKGGLPSLGLGSDITPKQSSVITKVKRTVSETATSVIKTVAKHGDNFLVSLLPWNQLRTVILILLFSFFPVDAIIGILPVLGFYLAFVTMLVSTFQIIHYRQQFVTFLLWLQIFQSADSALNTKCVEGKFCQRRIRPYIRFFLCAAIVVLLYPISGGGLMSSELACVSGSFYLMCLFVLNDFSCVTYLFVGISLLLSASRLMHASATAELLNSYDLLKFLTTQYKLELTDDIALTLTWSFIPGVLLLLNAFWIALRNSSYGFYNFFLPNLVALTWMQLMVVFFMTASWNGILRNAITVALSLGLPVFVILLVAYLILHFIVFFTSLQHTVPFLTTVFLIAVTTIGKFFIDKRELLSRGYWKKVLTVLQLLFAIYASLQFVPELRNFTFHDPGALRYDPVIDWPTYHSLCHKPAWTEKTKALVQVHCSHLVGLTISWQGNVKDVRLKQISNRLEEAVSYLPSNAAEWLRCVYGAHYEECSQDNMNEYQFKMCSLLGRAGVANSRCHLKEWNHYDFEISIQMSSGYWNSAEIFLSADNSFKDFVFYLHPGDTINFNGSLHSGIGGASPVILLSSVSCDDCAFSMDPIEEKNKVNIRREINKIFKFIFNDFFFPFLDIKHFRTT